MKRIVLAFVSMGLIASILFATSVKSWIRISYEFNKAEITALFCINKDKPALHCEGKCHLKNELKKENKKEAPYTLNHRIEIQFFCQKNSTINFHRYISCAITFPNYLKNSTEESISAIFHPPKLI